MSSDFLLSRSPLFNRKLQVVGYELRSPSIDSGNNREGLEAARAVRDC